MMRYNIKPDYHIKAKRGYLAAFYIELFLALQAGMVHFSSNETWKNVLAITGGAICLCLAGLAYWKYCKLVQNSEKETY
jgi:cobalamin biosynthesis protein CbiG